MSRTWEVDRHSDSSQEADSDTSLSSFIERLSTITAFPSSSSNKAATAREDKGQEVQVNEEEDSSTQKLPARGRATFTSNVPQREDSESPKTDLDFQVSSNSSSLDCATTSWILGTGMISEAIVGSMISGDGLGEKSIQSSGDGDIFEDAVEKVEAKDDDLGGIIIADDLYDSERKTSESEEEEESDYSIGEFSVHTNRISEQQAKFAAAFTVVILAMMWAWESRGSLNYGVQ